MGVFRYTISISILLLLYFLFLSLAIINSSWLKDTNGKLYYLNNDGTMAFNTNIDGYKLESDGAWIQ
ncbi:hypothetical protein [uncultured Clostridium sp.]|uniref:hypothetical protein n=1 Tax=uncultured Clostridium sp. TaxID=59620 RepID=UPI00345DE23E